MRIESHFFVVKTIILSLILSVTSPVSGQNENQAESNRSSDILNKNISLIIDRQETYVKNIYSDKIEAPRELINGKEYEPYYSRSKVKPLLYPEKIQTGSVNTQTRRYNNLILQYDTYLDELVLTDTSRNINYRYPQIALNKNIIEGFNLFFLDDSMTFKYLRAPGCTEVNLNEGFYEAAYSGQSQYFIKHESTFYVKDALDNYKYVPKDYINIGNGFFRIKSFKNLMLMLGDKSDAVKDYLHSSYIKVRKPEKNDIIRVLKFYDSL